LGRHSKPPRIRFPQATAGAAGTTVAGVAAAICLSPQAPAAAAVTPSASAHHATVPPAYQRGPTPAQLLAVAKHARAGSGHPASYTVRQGDTLSSISARYLGTSRRWQGLWSANRRVIGGNPDTVRAGEKLRLVNDGLTAGEWHHLRHLAQTAKQYQARHARQATTSTEEPTQSAPAASSAPAAQPAASGAGLSGVWACIAQHESGGNPATNTGNGFYGAFQFTLASWQAVGGPPGLPSNYPLSVQLHYAEVLQARSGWGNWPVTSRMCGV